MTNVAGRAFDEAIALGHHWAGEEHILLALTKDETLMDPLGLTHSGLAEHIGDTSPPFERTFEGCLSAPSYHTILGRATGYALGAGRAHPRPVDFLAALVWEPAGVPSRLLARAGTTRAAAVALAAGHDLTIPAAPTPNPLPAAAEAEALALGHSFVGDDHVLLALLAGRPDDSAGRALRHAGASHEALAARVARLVATSDPPVPPAKDRTSATPNPRCRQLTACAEGWAAMHNHGTVSSTDALVAYLWQDQGQQVITLEALGISADDLLRGLDTAVPAAPRPQPDRTPWGERIEVPSERMPAVIARLDAELPAGSWGCNNHGGREWVVAHADIDLAAIVAEVLATKED